MSATETKAGTTYSAGPWSVEGQQATLYGRPAYTIGNRELVVAAANPYAVSAGNDRDLSNARLIAASPELLEALQVALRTIDAFWPPDSPENESQVEEDRIVACVRQQSRAAIAKALGGTHA